LTYLFIILQAQSDGIASLVSSLLPFILIIAVFYFLILRPQQKRQKERAKLLEGVKKGDKIITSGGFHGTVEGVEDDSVLVKIADNVKVKMDKSAIGTIVGLTDQGKK
jgi:preprotein translocase subunit YajC